MCFLVFQEVKNFSKSMTVYWLKLDLVRGPRFPVDRAKLSGTSLLPSPFLSSPPLPFPPHSYTPHSSCIHSSPLRFPSTVIPSPPLLSPPTPPSCTLPSRLLPSSLLPFLFCFSSLTLNYSCPCISSNNFASP